MARLHLSRDQLASFLKDFEQIKQFEQLFTQSNDDTEAIEIVLQLAGAAISAANEANAAVQRIQDMLDRAPVPSDNAELYELRDAILSAPLPFAPSSLSAGAGLTGGGNMGANVALTVGAGAGITVNADDIALTLVTASGTYTPTLTNVTNLDASTAYACQYLQVGPTVTVSGRVDVDPTAAAQWRLGISLPVASNFAAEENCGGTAFNPSNSGGAAIRGDATNDRAEMAVTAVSTANHSMFFTFTYRII